MIRRQTIIIAFLLIVSACRKSEYLDTKNSSSYFVPTSPEHLQGVLDDELVFGMATYLNTLSADEFYFTENFLIFLSQSERNAYTWEQKIFDEVEVVADWDDLYAQIYKTNVVIEGVHNALKKNGNETELNPIKGDAYFKRGLALYELSQLFSRPYDSATADTEFGIPLRLSTDSKEPLSRGSVKGTYEQIIADIKLSIDLLPSAVNTKYRNRSSQPAAWALLARIYLSMRAYSEAAHAAEKSRSLYDSLINYNDLTLNTQFPFSPVNKETLYQRKMPGRNLLPALLTRQAFIDTHLISLYAPGDLRPQVFFNKTGPVIKGSYSGDIYPFQGLGVDEVYLILAECYVRLNQHDRGLQVMNALLQTRWKTGQYIPYGTSSADAAKQFILTERQKQLLFRGQRWSDIRRLNKEGFAIDLTRRVGGQLYTITHNDNKFVLPIPPELLKYNYQQNPR